MNAKRTIIKVIAAYAVVWVTDYHCKPITKPPRAGGAIPRR